MSILFKYVKDKRIIEVGSVNINGSLRSHIEKFKPKEYIGVDISEGKGVDIICNAYDLITKFGKESFDILISTEVLEHVEDWRLVISNFKNILRPGGFLLLTTRSIGFGFHEYPCDFWRYEEEDMNYIFSDFIINKIKKDSLAPGIFIKATKSNSFSEVDLLKYELYNIVEKKKTL